MFEDSQESKQTSNSKKTKDNPNTPYAQQILKAYQTVYLFKWLFPETVIQNHLQKTSKSHRSKSAHSFLKENCIYPNFKKSQ